MKKLLIIFSTVASFALNAQTVTDSVNTSIGDFILVTSEQVNSSNVYSEESITTSDGGNGEFVAISSNARFLLTPVVSTELQINLAPNPTSDVVELKVSGMSGAANITVTNVLGQVVYSTTTNVDVSKQVFLPAQLWESGNYLVVVSNGQEVSTERVVVK